MTKKVRQRAAVEVTLLTYDFATTMDSLRDMLRGTRTFGVNFPTGYEVKKYRDFVIFSAEVTYTAVGANRDDINKRVREHVDALAVIVAPRATITKLGERA